MLRFAPIAASCVVVLTSAAWAQQPINLLPPSPPVQEREAEPATANPVGAIPVGDKPLLEEPSPDFQAVRPADTAQEKEAGVKESLPVNAAAPPVGPIALPQAAAAEPLSPGGAPMTEMPMMAPPEMAAMMHHGGGVPTWALGVLVMAGAFLAGLFGIIASMLMRRGEMRDRRRAVAATLAAELETRRLAFDAVPLPPNVDAGVSFVSSVTSLAGIDAGFRAMQGQVHLLPEKVVANVSVHYAAVQRVSDFVKGQSLAAAVRMLQANRLGGHPCPDAGAMRDAHEELDVAFRGLEKLIVALKALR